MSIKVNLWDSEKGRTEKSSAVLVVAHPDDEVLFGWRSFHDFNVRLVICVTNKKNLSRRLRLIAVSKIYRFKLIHWDFSDKYPYQFDLYTLEAIEHALNTEFSNLGVSDHILTHSCFGEYGHSHHSAIAKMVSEYVKNENLEERFFQFTFGEKPKNFTIREHLSHFIYFGLFRDPRDARHIETSKWVYLDNPTNSLRSEVQFLKVYGPKK